jgi:hypothetical protein
MSYNIEIKEEWYKDPTYGKLKNKWNWFVYDDQYITILDQGSAAYSETDARLQAERAATLHHKQQHASRVEYEFTPED